MKIECPKIIKQLMNKVSETPYSKMVDDILEKDATYRASMPPLTMWQNPFEDAEIELFLPDLIVKKSRNAKNE